MPEEKKAGRTLTEGDIQAFADEMEKRMAARFYTNIGRGVWGLVWRALVAALLATAAYGSIKGIK